MCFGPPGVEQILIWLIIICVVIAALRLVVSFILPKVGAGDDVVVFTAAVVQITICISAMVVVADLISCLLVGGIGLPRLH